MRKLTILFVILSLTGLPMSPAMATSGDAGAPAGAFQDLALRWVLQWVPWSSVLDGDAGPDPAAPRHLRTSPQIGLEIGPIMDPDG